MDARNGLRIARRDLHVWRADLDVRAETREELWNTLDAGERDHANRLRVPRDHERYVAAHGALRGILGAYLRASPQSLVFEHNEFGKPSLARSPNSTLQFNISRAGAIMICAIASDARVGVDVEEIAGARDGREDSYFSDAERAALARVPPPRRAAAIAACWTRKEAFVKACGQGVSLPFESFDVSVPPAAPRLIATRPDPAEAGRWLLSEIAVAGDYVSTVAVEGMGWQVTQLAWPGDLP